MEHTNLMCIRPMRSLSLSLSLSLTHTHTHIDAQVILYLHILNSDIVSGRNTCKIQTNRQFKIAHPQFEASRGDGCQSFRILQEHSTHYPLLRGHNKKSNCKTFKIITKLILYSWLTKPKKKKKALSFFLCFHTKVTVFHLICRN